ncbi:kinase-like protein [Thelephora ganbajun]|uniref:Kinase-like protein n=1 Tax=Thelephora ganbajun TaxID=370292 RepID=A0ACB6Z7P8_THEGA|nr:kinase-like protein [Thelephora ganbajun]
MAAPRNTTYKLICHFARGNVPQAETPQVLSTIFDAQDHRYHIRQLPEQDLRMWIDRLDQTIDSRICAEPLRRRALRSLGRTCGSRGILPSSHYFHGRLYKTSNRPVSGGPANLWKVTDDRKHIFAAKVFCAYLGEDYKIKKKSFYKEVTVWKRLNHPNVVPILGAEPDFSDLCTVSPWMPEGNLLQYLKNYPGADRMSIMIGVADGLSYLHSNDVVHGDMNGASHINYRGFLNILFDSTGIPQITDFRIYSIIYDLDSHEAFASFRDYSMRWAAPEILETPNNNSRRPTKMSDVYAFGMVVVEIFTGNIPFPDVPNLNVYSMVMKGKRPPKPADASKLGLSSAAWKLVKDCWNKKRDKRPDMQYVALHLRNPDQDGSSLSCGICI